MRWLLFLSRLAFICGLCFAVSVTLHFKDWLQNQELVSTIVVIGHFMGMLVVPVTVLCYAGVAIVKKNLFSVVPRWLVIANLFFLVLLGVYIYLRNT